MRRGGLPRCRGFLRNADGVVAMEFGLLLPVMIVMAFGSFEVTRMIRASLRLNDVAQTVADLVAQQDTITASGMANFCTGGGFVMTPFSATPLDVSVASVTYSSASAGRVLDWSDTTCGAGTAIASPTTLAVADTPTVKDSVIIAQAVYVYTPIVNTIVTSTFTMTRTAYARPRNGTTVSHY